MLQHLCPATRSTLHVASFGVRIAPCFGVLLGRPSDETHGKLHRKTEDQGHLPHCFMVPKKGMISFGSILVSLRVFGYPKNLMKPPSKNTGSSAVQWQFSTKLTSANSGNFHMVEIDNFILFIDQHIRLS